MKPGILNRLSELEKVVSPETRIIVDWSVGDHYTWPLPDGTLLEVTRAEFIKRGGKIVDVGIDLEKL
jgi:hypothetical protein